MSHTTPVEWLERFLNIYWLRPETALIFAYDATMYNKYRVCENSSIDIGCGDGTTSFILNGGLFSPHFDAYYSTNTNVSYIYKDRKPFQPNASSDFYDAFNPSQFKGLGKFIIKYPDINFLYGIDWKQNLLHKASRLGLYKNLLLHDSNKPFKSIKDESLSYVFSNTIYWVADREGLIKEITRMLKPPG